MADPNDPEPVALWPLPDQRHLYMIVAGILLGVLLSPAALGRLAPDVYDRVFIGSGDLTEFNAARDALQAFDSDSPEREKLLDDIIRQYAAVGDPGDSVMTARDEQIAQINNRFADERAARVADLLSAEGPVVLRREEHAKKLQGIATTLLLALAIVFAVESILGPPTDQRRRRVVLPPTLGRLVTIRYALIAGWLLLMLAQPASLRQISPAFGITLVAVVLVAGLVPLGKKHVSA